MNRHLKAIVAVFVLAFIGVWAFNKFFLAKTQQVPSSVMSLEQMEKQGVPNFSAKDLDGKPFELHSLGGKVVILNFWASWCAPCIEEIPSLLSLVKEFKGDVQLVAVSGDSSREDIDVFMKAFPDLKNHKDIKMIWDEDRSIMQQFEVSRLPESLVVGKDNKLKKKIVGTIDWYNEDSLAYMKDLLK